MCENPAIKRDYFYFVFKNIFRCAMFGLLWIFIIQFILTSMKICM